EDVRRYAALDPMQFAFNLLTRSGRITHLSLELRDPRLVAAVDGWFANPGTGDSPRVAPPPPLLAPLALRDRRLTNRVALSAPGGGVGREGPSGPPDAASFLAAAGLGAGLIVTDLVAVSPEGRITPGSAGLFRPEHAEAWGRL